MAPRSLVQQFTYGNFGDLPIFSAETDFFVGGLVRQRELVALAKSQVALVEETCTVIREGTHEISSMVRRELERQTAELSSVIRKGTDMVVSAVDDLADRVIAELVEVRWQLVQLRRTNEQTLEVLKRPRSTEAQELLQQGIRNLVNDKLEQAEDRFLRALDLDNTDYQVLMNLSAVALRKGNAQQVLTYLQDALTLPQELDNRARAEALWSLARFHYTQSDYNSAVRLAKESLALFPTPRRVFQYGIYQILASGDREGFSTIESSIRMDPCLFGFAATSPDLAPYRVQVGELHSALASQVVSRVRAVRDHLVLQIPAFKALPMIATGRLAAEFSQQLAAIGTLLERGSYSELCAALEHAERLRPVFPAFERLSVAEQEFSSTTAQYDRAVSELSSAEAALARNPAGISSVGCIGAALGAIVSFCSFVISYGDNPQRSGVEILILKGSLVFTLFLIVRAIVGQYRRARCEQALAAARQSAEKAKVLLGSANLHRASACRGASIPAWPISAR